MPQGSYAWLAKLTTFREATCKWLPASPCLSTSSPNTQAATPCLLLKLQQGAKQPLGHAQQSTKEASGSLRPHAQASWVVPVH